MSEQPATDAGTTKPAGEGIADEELAEEVEEQTSGDLKAEEIFADEADGAKTDTEAAKTNPDELT